MRAWAKVGTILSCGFWLAGCAADVADHADETSEESGEIREDLSRPALSKRQEATVLKLIDDICGDTWCEGDNNFSFDRLDCRAGCAGKEGSCRLSFRIFSYDTDLETGPTYSRSCVTKGFTGFDSLVTTTGQYQALNGAYYDALTQCIASEEATLPR